MKKVLSAVLFIALVLLPAGCGKNQAETVIRNVESEMYSQEEISSAISIIQKEVKEKWNRCTLTEIYYAGDEISGRESESRNANVIVLTSSMYVGRNGGDGSLNSDFTYDGWMWVLVKSDNGEWIHIDHGY